MLFPTFEFFLFFAVVLLLNWLLKKYPLAWRLFLLAASYFFYSVWDIKFLALLIFVSAINFFAGFFIQHNFFRSRRIFFGLGILINIIILGFFKYYDFFRVSAETLLRRIGFLVNLPLIEIILPIGISFYIFRAISYLVDTYQQKIRAEESWLDFFLYIAFFPHLLSGPIARAGDFLVQLKNGGAKNIAEPYRYWTLIVLGFFKKVVISTLLTVGLVDDVFAVPENHAQQVVILAVLAYYLVIYFDFSGYSDMAIGFAGLLGFKSPDNFNSPYLALNLKDFWRRWHITLSSWIRDYIYIPLGGNRKGKIRKYLNLIFSMLAAGLWHGASFNFIIWGGIHSIGIFFNHLWQDIRQGVAEQKKTWAQELKNYSKVFFGWLITFIFISLSWVFFRAASLADAGRIFKAITHFSAKAESLPIYLIILMLAGFLLVFFEQAIVKGLIRFQKIMPVYCWFIFVVFLMILLFSLSPDTTPLFIYFSF